MDEKGWFEGMKASLRAVFGTNERVGRNVGSDPVSLSAEKIDRLAQEMAKPVPVLTIEEAMNYIGKRH